MATKRKPPIFRFDLTWQEYNYVTQSMRNCTRQMKTGSQLGNIPYLVRFTEKTLKKLERLQQAQLRRHIGEKEWSEHRRFVNKLIRDANKSNVRNDE